MGRERFLKALIVTPYNLSIYPLTKVYTRVFEKYGISYDVVYLDRNGTEETSSAGHTFRFNLYPDTPLLRCSRKIRLLERIEYKLRLQMFKNYVEGLIKKGGYDFVVLWGEDSAYLFSRFVSKNMPGKYSINVRDVWNAPPQSYIDKLRRAVKKSAFNTVSSDGFIERLPEADYIFIHSANEDVVSDIVRRQKERKEPPYTILNIGSFRSDQYAFDVMDAFGNDRRFIMAYFGSGTERMEEYCRNKGYNNFICKGRFDIGQTAELLGCADIINCAYGSDCIAETSKMPIRFYYAIYLGVPILMTEGTRIAYYSDKLGMGLALPGSFDGKTGVADAVYEKYMNIDVKKMRSDMDAFIEDIEESHVLLEKRICKTLDIAYRD